MYVVCDICIPGGHLCIMVGTRWASSDTRFCFISMINVIMVLYSTTVGGRGEKGPLCDPGSEYCREGAREKCEDNKWIDDEKHEEKEEKIKGVNCSCCAGHWFMFSFLFFSRLEGFSGLPCYYYMYMFNMQYEY